VYTDLLWAFEGITSYYDDLALLRSGLIDAESYLELLAQTVTRVQRGSGRLRQSAAESSFNAWTKFYKQDENSTNAIVSYYAKGSLIAACIDLKIRELSASKQSLDDVMRRLWEGYREQGRGVEPDSIQQLVSEITGQDLEPFLDELIYGTGELPLDELLGLVGIEVLRRTAKNSQDRGGKDVEGDLPTVDLGAVLKDGEAGLTIQRVTEAGSAQSAGLSAGDQIIAIDGLRLNLGQLEKRLLLASPVEVWQVHAFRRDELHLFEVALQAAAQSTCVLKITDQQQEARKSWFQRDA